MKDFTSEATEERGGLTTKDTKEHKGDQEFTAKGAKDKRKFGKALSW